MAAISSSVGAAGVAGGVPATVVGVVVGAGSAAAAGLTAAQNEPSTIAPATTLLLSLCVRAMRGPSELGGGGPEGNGSLGREHRTARRSLRVGSSACRRRCWSHAAEIPCDRRAAKYRIRNEPRPRPSDSSTQTTGAAHPRRLHSSQMNGWFQTSSWVRPRCRRIARRRRYAWGCHSWNFHGNYAQTLDDAASDQAIEDVVLAPLDVHLAEVDLREPELLDHGRDVAELHLDRTERSRTLVDRGSGAVEGKRCSCL